MSAVVEVVEFMDATGWGDLQEVDLELPATPVFKSEFCESLLQRLALAELVGGTEYL